MEDAEVVFSLSGLLCVVVSRLRLVCLTQRVQISQIIQVMERLSSVKSS